MQKKCIKTSAISLWCLDPQYSLQLRMMYKSVMFWIKLAVGSACVEKVGETHLT